MIYSHLHFKRISVHGGWDRISTVILGSVCVTGQRPQVRICNPNAFTFVFLIKDSALSVSHITHQHVHGASKFLGQRYCIIHRYYHAANYWIFTFLAGPFPEGNRNRGFTKFLVSWLHHHHHHLALVTNLNRTADTGQTVKDLSQQLKKCGEKIKV